MGGLGILARLSWLRLWRGRTKWLTALLALLPPLLATLLAAGGEEDAPEMWRIVMYLTLRLPVLLAVAVHLAPAVGDELESRTYTYLWSRPTRRSAMLFGKLLATAPAIAAIFALSVTATWLLVWQADAAAHLEELARALAATIGVVLSSAALSLAASAWFPRRPLAFLLAYLSLGERLFEFVPLLQQISITVHAASISAAHPGRLQVGTLADGLLGLSVLSAAWLALAVWRVESAEYALPDG